MAGQTTAKKWAVSKSRSVALSKPFADGLESSRYRNLSNALRDLQTEEDVIDEVHLLWGEAQEKLLTIGRYLVKAKEKFRGTYEATILPRLPFGKGVAYQLRVVAGAVDDGLILEQELPRSYSTAYQLASLPREDLAQARELNLVRRDVLRREVEAFRVSLRPSVSVGSQNDLLHEWHALANQLSEAFQRISEIENEIGIMLDKQNLKRLSLFSPFKS
jgi:hypothetical protein